MSDCDHDIVTDYLGYQPMDEKKYEAFVKSQDQKYVENFGNSIWLLVVCHGTELIHEPLIPEFTYATRIMSMAKYAYHHLPDYGGGSINPVYINAIFKWAKCFKLSSILDFPNVINKLQETIRSLGLQFGADLPYGIKYSDIGLIGSTGNDSLFDFNEKMEVEKLDNFCACFLTSSLERDKNICVSEEYYRDCNILTNKGIQRHLLGNINPTYRYLLQELIETKEIKLSKLIILLSSLGYQNCNIISINCREVSKQPTTLKELAYAARLQDQATNFRTESQKTLDVKKRLQQLLLSEHKEMLRPLIKSYENFLFRQFKDESIVKDRAIRAVRDHINHIKDIEGEAHLLQKKIGTRSRSRSRSRSMSRTRNTTMRAN